MALVRYGGGIIQMSGSIAGNTYARNRYGNYARARTKPVNPNTELQQAIRGIITALTTRWSQTLTSDERTAWNLYAANVAMKNKLGETVRLSGFNHYIRSNSVRVHSGIAEIDAGPTVFELPEKDPTLSIVADDGDQTISVTYDNELDWADETGAYLITYQGQPQNPQRNFFAGPWRLLDNLPGVTGTPPTPPDVQPVVFVITELQRQWIYARIARADGRLSEPFRADTFCVA